MARKGSLHLARPVGSSIIIGKGQEKVVVIIDSIKETDKGPIANLIMKADKSVSIQRGERTAR
jgi:hypothetical protein